MGAVGRDDPRGQEGVGDQVDASERQERGQRDDGELCSLISC